MKVKIALSVFMICFGLILLRNLEGFIMATTIQNNHPFNIANVILALSIGILVIVVAVPVLLIFLNSFWVDGQF